MATWVPAPSTAAVTSTGTTWGAGKMVAGSVIGTVAQQPPSPPWIPAPATGSNNDGTDVFTTG